MSDVRLVYGDTSRVPFKVIGTGGSTASSLGTGSVLAAATAVKHQIQRIGAHLLTCDPDDVEIIDAQVSVRGAPSSAMPLAEIARITYLQPLRIPADMDPALEATATYVWPGQRYTVATHGCIVEVDPRTGSVHIDRYVAAVDCGTVINPAIVEGQVRGGIAQGIAGVLYENALYDEDSTISFFYLYGLPASDGIGDP